MFFHLSWCRDLYKFEKIKRILDVYRGAADTGNPA